MAINTELAAIERLLDPTSPAAQTSKDFHFVLISLYSFASFGTDAIGGILRSHGFRVTNIYFKKPITDNMSLPTEIEYAKILDVIGGLKPDIVGISTMSTFAPAAMKLLDAINELDIHTIVGGAHAIYNPEECIIHADFVCVGEGEVPMLMLGYALLNGEDPGVIKNLWVKDGDNVKKNELLPLLQNLDLIPFPDFRDADKYYIEGNMLFTGEPFYKKDSLAFYNFMSGRGCPFQCTYCCNSYLIRHFKGKGSFLRRRSVDSVIRELKRAKDTFPKLSVIASNDEIFVSDKKWLAEFCTRYKNEIDIAFHCDIHPSRVSDETIAFLKHAGLKTITVGVESGSERIRREIFNRRTPTDQIIGAGHIFKKYGVLPSYDFIFDNPYETSEDLEASLNLLLKLPRPFRTNTYSMQYLPNTDLTLRLLSEKIITESDIAGYSLKGLDQLHVRMDLHRNNPEIYFIYSMFKLFSYTFVFSTPSSNFRRNIFPTRLIKKLIQRKDILQKHLNILNALCNLGSLGELSGRALSLICSGNFGKIVERLSIHPRIGRLMALFVGRP